MNQQTLPSQSNQILIENITWKIKEIKYKFSKLGIIQAKGNKKNEIQEQ